MSTNLPVLARSLEEGRSIPFLRLRGERNTTPRACRERVRERNQATPIQKTGGKRRERATQSFVQTKQEQERTSSLSLSPLPFPSLAHQIQFLPRHPSRIRRNSFPSRPRLLPRREICFVFLGKKSCFGRPAPWGDAGWRLRWPSRGHGRGGARRVVCSPDAEDRQAQPAAAQCQESLR
jgi:hypothetical protein